MPLTWIPFIMITVFLFGIGQVFTKTGTTRLGSPGMLLLLSINMVAIYGGAWLFFHGDAPLLAEDLLSCVVAAFLSALGYIFYYEAVERQKISIVGVITAAYPFVTVILAFFFLDESLTALQVIAIALIITSVSLLSYAPEEQGGSFKRKSWLLCAVLCFTIWGIWSVVAKYTIDTVGPVTYAGVYAVVGPAVFVPYWGMRSGKFRVTREDIPAELSVSFFCVGALFFYAALDYGYVSIVTAFSDLYPFITVFFAWILLSEKLEMHHKIAVALALSGIVVLAFV